MMLSSCHHQQLPGCINKPCHPSGIRLEDGASVSIFSLSGANSQDGHLAAARNGVKRLRTQFDWLIGAQYKPMELLKNDWATIRKSPPWAMDSWGLGCLIYELFSATKLTKTEELRNTGLVPKSLLPDYQRLLSSTPSRRMNAAKLIENSGPTKLLFHSPHECSDVQWHEMRLKGTSTLDERLSQRTITGSLLKYLSKLQVDEEPAIRTNTTILLGNIAGYLNEGTRRRVLINAFTVRALRDGFAPARAAGVMALSATSAYYDPAEIATRILPNVVVLTVDPDSWAMSSLTLKGKASEHTPISTSNSIVASAGHSTSKVSNSPALTPPAHLSPAVDHIENPAPPSPTSTDGWGDIDENGVREEESDKDGWDDMEVMEEQRPLAALANIHAAQQRPVIQPKLRGANSLPSRNPSRTAKDMSKISDDEDPWAAIAAPQPATSAKPLSATSATAFDDDDPWAAIATTTARRANSSNLHPSGSGRGRGNRAAPMKLGAQRLGRNTEL